MYLSTSVKHGFRVMCFFRQLPNRESHLFSGVFYFCMFYNQWIRSWIDFLHEGVFLFFPKFSTHSESKPHMGFPGSSVVKIAPADAIETGDASLIPESGRSPGEGNGNSLQYSCLENLAMARGAWQTAVHGVAKSRTWQKWLNTLCE